MALNLLLVFGSLLLGLLTLAPFVWLMTRVTGRNLRWNSSADAQEMSYLEQQGLVATARVRSIEPWATEPVVEVRHLWAGPRAHATRTQTFERVGARLVLELLPVGAAQPIVVERTQTVRRAEIPQIVPGAFVQVLYDPRQPARFYLDTVERAQMITAATLRTQQAVQQMAAAHQWASFSAR